MAIAAKNIPRGLYRNTLGAELVVLNAAMNPGEFRTLCGDIAVAESRDPIFKTVDRYLVTQAALDDCGYELIEPEAD
jgi:hypothetical protein